MTHQKNKMTREEFLAELDHLHNTGKTSPIRKNHSKTKVPKPTISTVSGIRGVGEDLLHSGPLEIEIKIYGPPRADIDNIAKGILDSLNRVAYQDDRQVQKITVERICVGED